MDLERINELGFEKTSKWKSMVLIVSFSKWWNLMIAIQCYFVFLLCLSNLAFHYQTTNLDIMRYACDLFYVFEIIFTLSYRSNNHYRKLKHSFGRSWIFIFVDILSVIPVEAVYYFHYISDKKDDDSKFQKIFIQNRLLRIYRIFQLESLYGITVSKYSQYILFMFLLFTSKAILLAHVLCCIWVNIKQAVPCDSKKFVCLLWYECNMVNMIILNWSGEKDTLSKAWERFLAMIGIFLGVLLIYAYFYPFVFLVSMQLNYSRALYYDRYRKLLRLLQNMIGKKQVRKKVLKDFIDAWQISNDMQPQLKNIPLALQKEIFTDIYWEAFRHSDLLKSISRNCKRSLSLAMATNHYHSGEVIYLKGQKKEEMLFLIQGTVQVMAEENEKSPLLSFSSGTIFGEAALFLCIQSQAIMKCKSYCEFQILSKQKAFRVLNDYPKDKKKIFQRLQQRVLMGRYTQWRKNEFHLKEQTSLGIDSTVEDCVKWIKTQWSAVSENHRRQQMIIRAIEEGQRIPSFHRTLRPNVKIEFISNFLELIVLSDAFEEKKDAVCLRTKFPWSIDPAANFLKVWCRVILLSSFIPIVSYPLCTAWLPYFPRFVYQFSYVITILYQVDVLVKLFTAVKTKHTIHTEFNAVLRQRLKELTFYLDIIAAFPYQIFIFGRLDEFEAYQMGLFLHPAILKFHIFVTLKIPFSPHMAKMTFIKNCLILTFLLYLFSEFIQLNYVRNFNRDLTRNTWINRFLAGRESKIIRLYLISVIHSVSEALSIPDCFMYPGKNTVLIIQCMSKYIFFLFFCYFLGDFYGAYMIKIFSQETFLVLVKRIIKFLNGIYLPKKVVNQLLKTVKFQWDHNCGDYISSNVPIIKSTSFDLRKDVYSDSAYKTLRSCKIFQHESIDCLIDVMEKSFIVAVPAGSLLVSYGHTSHMLNILHRGACQISSFLAKDNIAGLGWPIIAETGCAFPLLSTFCNVPAPIAVVSITDCEIIMIHLDDLLKIFMDFNVLKDILDVLKELDLLKKLKDVRPGLIQIEEQQRGAEPQRLMSKIFRKSKPITSFLTSCLLGSKFANMKFVKKWETFFAFYLIVLSIVWPTCFGLFAYSSHILVPILLFSKLIIIVNFFISFRCPYYNEIGILVTHPAYTFWNYLSSSFIVDVICFVPVFTIFRYKIVDPMTSMPIWVISFNFLQHFLKVFHILGCLDALKDVFNNSYAIPLIKTVILFLIAFNLFANFMMYVLADWVYESRYKIIGFDLPKKYCPDNPSLLRKNSLIDYYIFISYWILSNLNTNDFGLNLPKETQLYVGYGLNIIGTFLNFYLYCWIASNSFFTYLGETLFQEKITSLVKFLELEDANVTMIERALSFYGYEWSKTRGENLKNVFERLPPHLQEELVYPLYRSTLSKNEVFANADEGFYKILTKYLRCVYFSRGTVIIFQNEVQSDLYFLHKGKCFVYDWFIILDAGSVIGDIKRKGLMENKIYALTNVELLKISTNDFFMVINNFDELEKRFFRTTALLENFIKCRALGEYFQLHPVDSKDVLNAFGLQRKVIGFEDESYFEETDKSSMLMRKTLKYKAEEKKRLFIIYPGTWKMKMFVSFLQVDAFLTVVFLPILALFASLTKEAFGLIGVLDFFWLIGILLSFRVGYIDKVKGDVITDFKFVAKKYLKRWDGFIIDFLALVPFDLIYVATFENLDHVDSKVVSYLRCFRFLRMICLLKGIRMESRKLKTNHYLAYLHAVLHMIVGVSFLASLYLLLSADPSLSPSLHARVLNLDQFFILVTSCEHVVNFFASSNLYVLIPDSRLQLIFSIAFAILLPYLKGILISQSLSIMHAKGLVKFNYKSQVVALESYLVSRDTSPCIIKEALSYMFKLLEFGRSENMPSLLVKCPPHLKIKIMRDLYLTHLQKCPLFENVDTIFLEQLLERMKREVYFSGQQIVEQFDVDHRLYFIHKGEVYIINQTKEKAYVEFVVGKMMTGEYFGEASGLWFSLPHRYTYRARTTVEAIVLHSDDWMDLRRSFPRTAEQILAKAKALRII